MHVIAARTIACSGSACRTPTDERRVSSSPLIAVIEDDAPLRHALTGLLRSHDRRVEGYATAEAFLAANRDVRFDCIVTDIQMPGLSGIELRHMLAAAGVAVPVIMITARPEPLLYARATDSGAFCILHKPFEAKELIACLDRAFAQPHPSSSKDG